MNSKWSYSPEILNTEIADFFALVTLKFDGWRRKTIGNPFYPPSSFAYYFVSICEFKLKLQSGNADSGQNNRFSGPCDLEIWRMTLKTNRTPVLYNCKLCTWFRNHLWIQTGVTVRKHPSWGKICFDLCDLDLWLLTLTFYMDITSVNGNSSWNFHDDSMKGT